MAGRDLERPDLYVVARLLERLWREDAPMLKTRLQVAANVNYDVFSRYLIAREHIVIHIRCDLQSSLEHRSVLTPQTFQESSHHVEVRPLEVPPSHRFTGPRCTGSSPRGSGRSALSSRGGLSASPLPTDVSNVGKIESR